VNTNLTIRFVNKTLRWILRQDTFSRTNIDVSDHIIKDIFLVFLYANVALMLARVSYKKE
jgi:hypothetical protein